VYFCNPFISVNVSGHTKACWLYLKYICVTIYAPSLYMYFVGTSAKRLRNMLTKVTSTLRFPASVPKMHCFDKSIRLLDLNSQRPQFQVSFVEPIYVPSLHSNDKCSMKPFQFLSNAYFMHMHFLTAIKP
jgi:hypothetical protein